jgi:mono/diheme cytochrome c family protein
MLSENSDSGSNNMALYQFRGIQQLEALNGIDRCTSCHLGIENPGMINEENPFSYHPGSFLDNHITEEYGCTICHGGQGRALNPEDAHAIHYESHWNHPLLPQPYIQSSCGQCHLSIFSANKKFEGTEVFSVGQEIFNREGCLGCHKARGVGGSVGPDLTLQGEKTRQEYSFDNISLEPTIANWLKEHFRDPEMVSPGSKMLKMDLPDEELLALTTFVLGLRKPDIDFKYFTLETLKEFKGDRSSLDSEMLFSMACSGCHGKDGEGKSYEIYKTGVPGILNEDFLRVASKEYIGFTMEKGRSQRLMSSWLPVYSGLRQTEIEDLSNFIHFGKFKVRKEYNPELELKANAIEGKKLYENNCMTCHGYEGKGGVALAINKPDFLKFADNNFLFNTIMLGRENATMPSWQNLSDKQIYNILKYIRSWQTFLPAIKSMSFNEINSDKGRIHFHFLCSRCHGEHGEGQTGPMIINRQFMEIASDTYLFNTISFGREHTAMFGWSKDVYNAEKLTKEDVGNIIAHLRTEASKKSEYIYAGSNPGNLYLGEGLYSQHCAECHGGNGEGILAPALNNQELLNAASNGNLLATISIGREGSKMPEWGKDTENHTMLSSKERQDIVAWIRAWERIRIAY